MPVRRDRVERGRELTGPTLAHRAAPPARRGGRGGWVALPGLRRACAGRAAGCRAPCVRGIVGGAGGVAKDAAPPSLAGASRPRGRRPAADAAAGRSPGADRRPGPYDTRGHRKPAGGQTGFPADLTSPGLPACLLINDRPSAPDRLGVIVRAGVIVGPQRATGSGQGVADPGAQGGPTTTGRSPRGAAKRRVRDHVADRAHRG